ncbi:MAG TPA: hypothetical protein PKL77_07270 [Candidatus Omnitrophota bacterium]|nr:hypothetical protein [Candidatus Omnitrophota bacterium]
MKKEIIIKPIKAIAAGIRNGWKHAWKFFSADPVASMCRALAVFTVLYVAWEGHRYLDKMTPEQSHFLIGYLGGVLPFVFEKLGTAVSTAITAFRKPPTTGEGGMQ